MSSAPTLSVITTERRTGRKDMPAHRPPTRAEDMDGLHEMLQRACDALDRVENAAGDLSETLKQASG